MLVRTFGRSKIFFVCIITSVICSDFDPGEIRYTRRDKQSTPVSIAYGGILNKWRVAMYNDSDIQDAAEYAVQYAMKTKKHTVATGSNGKPLLYKIMDAKVLTLVYTADGQNAHQVQIVDQDDPHQGMEIGPLEWGYTYTFNIAWPQHLPWLHSFTVTHYWDDDFYVFSHTFQRHAFLASNSLETPPISKPDLATEFQTIAIPAEESDISLSLNCNSKTAANCDKEINHDKSNAYQSQDSHSTANIDGNHISQEHELTDKKRSDDRDSVNSDSACDSFDTDCKEPINQEHAHNKYTKEAQSYQDDDSLTQSKKDFHLKILTFNVWNFNSRKGTEKSYQKRIKHLAKLCREVDADIIAFQEVRFQDGRGGTWGPNQVEHLAKLLQGYQFVYQPAQVQRDTVPMRTEEGVAVFSRHPVLNSDFILLTRNSSDVADGHQRILLHAEILLPSDERVDVYNTHLSLSHLARAVSVKEIWQQIRDVPGPVFFMGDLNAEAHNEEVQFLQGKHAFDGRTTHGLHDVWLMKHGPTDPGFTFNAMEKHLSKRIDLIFMKQCANVQLKDVQVLDDGKRGAKAASDHLGLLATFIIKPV